MLPYNVGHLTRLNATWFQFRDIRGTEPCNYEENNQVLCLLNADHCSLGHGTGARHPNSRLSRSSANLMLGPSVRWQLS